MFGSGEARAGVVHDELGGDRIRLDPAVAGPGLSGQSQPLR